MQSTLPRGEQSLAETAGNKPDPYAKIRNKWLNAHVDPLAGLKATTARLALADLNGDGEDKLVVADGERKLKIFKGTSLVSENALMDTPSALCAFYMDIGGGPRTPSLAVAAGPHIFIYRNLRPYYKFLLPHLPINAKEGEVWQALLDEKTSIEDAVKTLGGLQMSGVELTARSLDLLQCDGAAARQQLVDKECHVPLSQQTVITCMTTVKKSMDEPTATSCLVVGTESRMVYILNSDATSIKTKVKLPSVPAYFAVVGLLDVEYRIIVACRNAVLYTIKGGELMGFTIELEAHPSALIALDSKEFLVATMSNTVHAYRMRGKKNYSIDLPAPITAMELLTLSRTTTTRCALVALANGEVRVYSGRHLVSIFDVDSIVTGMKFGQYGREDSALVLVTKSGTLFVKILSRIAKLDGSASSTGPPPEQDIPLKIFKKTRLYVEQTQREKENAVEMHRIFQRDLCKLRLTTAKYYLKMIKQGAGPISSKGPSLRIHPKISGLGPHFQLTLIIENTSEETVTNLPVTFAYNPRLYSMPQSSLVVPLLVPTLTYNFRFEVECINPQAGPESIQVYVSLPGTSVPVISAMVQMPASEADLD